MEQTTDEVVDRAIASVLEQVPSGDAGDVDAGSGKLQPWAETAPPTGKNKRPLAEMLARYAESVAANPGARAGRPSAKHPALVFLERFKPSGGRSGGTGAGRSRDDRTPRAADDRGQARRGRGRGRGRSGGQSAGVQANPIGRATPPQNERAATDPNAGRVGAPGTTGSPRPRRRRRGRGGGGGGGQGAPGAPGAGSPVAPAQGEGGSRLSQPPARPQRETPESGTADGNRGGGRPRRRRGGRGRGPGGPGRGGASADSGAGQQGGGGTGG